MMPSATQIAAIGCGLFAAHYWFDAPPAALAVGGLTALLFAIGMAGT